MPVLLFLIFILIQFFIFYFIINNYDNIKQFRLDITINQITVVFIIKDCPLCIFSVINEMQSVTVRYAGIDVQFFLFSLQKLYFLSQESGRSAAKYFVNSNPKFFTKDLLKHLGHNVTVDRNIWTILWIQTSGLCHVVKHLDNTVTVDRNIWNTQ